MLYVVQILNVAVFRATNSGCYEQNPVERDFGAWRSLRYRIEMVEKDLGTLSQTLLRKLLRKFSKNFQNFKQGDF